MKSRATTSRWCVTVAIVASAMLLATVAWAQPADEPAPAEAPSEPDAEALAEAKRLFKKGNELRKTKNYQRALEYYVKSRALVMSSANTLNAAACLRELGRFDEALEMYEQVITDFSDKLTAAQRKLISEQTAQLQRKLGSINVMANVKGSLVIDGRPRGDLPMLSPVRVLPGSRAVVIVKDGYRSFESTVEVEVGKTVTVQAKLEALDVSGMLRIEAPDHEGAELFIDGAKVGALPWEGTLEPGDHVYFVQQDDVGTAPEKVVVVKGQTSLVRAKPLPLGLETLITVKPPEASLFINAVEVGKGRWQGRLPIGHHVVNATERGYGEGTGKVVVDADSSANLELVLEVDPDHPRWGVSEEGLFVIDAFGGLALAPSFGSDAEAKCSDSACNNPLALGMLVGARAGYEFPFGLSVHLLGGYMRLSKTVDRAIADNFEDTDGDTVNTLYTLEDQLQITGGLAGAGVGYRNVLADPFELRANLSVGALFAFTRDTVTGTVTSGDTTIPVIVEESGKSVNDVDLFVMPELHGALRFGGFGFGIGLAAAIFVLEGPSHALAETKVNPPTPCDIDLPDAPNCAPKENIVRGEKAYSTFVVLLPHVGVSYAF